MDHSTDSFLAAGGITIFTQAWRPEGTPRARVVLVHGWAEHSGRYEHVATALTDAGYVVATYDQRGHGRSGGPRAVVTDFGMLTADLALYREELATGEDAGLPQVLLGHSLGGAVVLDHLLGSHAPVDAVVLSGPYVRNAAEVSAPLKVIAPLVGRFAPRLPTQQLDSSAVSRDPAVVAAYDEDPLNYRGGVPAGTAGQLLGLEARLMQQAATITEPVLIVHGTDDRLAAVSGSRELSDRLGSRDVELKTYDGLYHEVFNEPEQDQVLADVVTWLDAHVGDRSG